MIACGSPDLGMIAMILAPLGLCYLNSMFEVVRLICDKVSMTSGVIARNYLSIIICSIYIITIGRLDSELLAVSGIPLLVSLITLITAYAKKKDLIQN